MNNNTDTPVLTASKPVKSSGLAKASCICGRLGLLAVLIPLVMILATREVDWAVVLIGLLGLPLSTLAVGFGHLARWRLPKEPSIRKPCFGLVSGYLVLLGILGVCFGLFLPNYLRAKASADAGRCFGSNIRRVVGAKEQWALEHKQTATATPTWPDLVGKDKYLNTMPVCPDGGRYIIGNLSQTPYCTYHAGWLYDPPDWSGIVEVVDKEGRPNTQLQHITLYLDRTQYTNDYYQIGNVWMPFWHSRKPHLEISSGPNAYLKKHQVPITLPLKWPMKVVLPP